MAGKAADLDSIISFIKEGERFTLLSHLSPDGDTLGSALALMHLLKRLGKTCEVICPNPVPKIYAFLPGSEAVLLPEDAGGYDRVISVDCADTPRFGRAIRFFTGAQATAAIDHHVTNPRFAGINLVEPEASATAEVIFELYNRMDMPIDSTVAVCLYTGIVTDTGNLSYSNTTPSALRIIADFVEQGLVDISDLNRRIYRTVPYAKTRVQGFVTSRIRLECGGAVGIGTLTQAQMHDFNAT
ncbi:MAG: DHH family phosphoesterase, partial [Clostridia bacterium]|nr:DHH family phosphoesterase [Clostridia bacterium]